MANNKLAIIGGSGLYDVEEFKNRELLDIKTPWGDPSDKILKTNYNNKEIYFLPPLGIWIVVKNILFLKYFLIIFLDCAKISTIDSSLIFSPSLKFKLNKEISLSAIL